MTPEQLQELDNIKNVAASLGNSVANLLVDMSENILLSEDILRKSLTPPPPPPEPTYQLVASSTVINEGENVLITLRTTNVAKDTKVFFEVSGSIDSADIVTPTIIVGSTGNFVVGEDGTASILVTTTEDHLTEGTESFTISLRDAPVSVTVSIQDTSLTPPPPPPPPPPIDPEIGKVITKKLNPLALIVPAAYVKDSTTYERYQTKSIVNYGSVHIYEFRVLNVSTPRPFRNVPYKLFIDGKELFSITVPAGTNVANFAIDTVALNLSVGDHLLEIVGDTDETCIPSSLFVEKVGAPRPTKMLAMMGSHDCHHNNALNTYSYAWVPYEYNPTVVPFVLKTREAFNTALDRRSLIAEEIVPVRRSDIYRPRNTNNVHNTCNSHNYLITPLMLKVPDKALLDGPRGVGTVNGPTHLQVGRVGGIYFCEGWRVGHISTDGTVRTIAGLRSKAVADRNNPPTMQDYELVGDWSSIPVERRGFHEIWGFAFWKRSLAVDESSEAMPNNGTLEKIHFAPGPVAFIADSQNNRIIKLQFAHNSHATPVVVTEFITGLADPWDCVEHKDILYVTERLANRISTFDCFTGKYLGDFKTGPTNLSMANLTVSDRKPYANVPLSTIQAQECVLPDGLFIYKDQLYMCSQIMQQVRKFDIATKQLLFTYNLPSNYFNGYYLKPAVSDGTFGPEGTLFLEGWASNTSNGWPSAFLPDGTSWPYFFGEGPGKVFDTVDYGSAVGVGNGILVFGSSLEGLTIVRKAIAGEKSYKWGEGYKDSLDEWQRLGYTLVHGRGGFGHYNLPLPWNVNAKIDYYLEMYGHVKPI